MSQSTLRYLVSAIGLALLVVVAPPRASADDLYVSMLSGIDQPLSGSPSDPYQTISYALTWALPGDVIKVAGGTTADSFYTAANGESFPIMLADGVKIIGDEPIQDQGRWPRIGGDVGSSQEALIVLDATGADNDISRVELRQLRFMGENVTGQDSPVAIKITVSDENAISGLLINNNVFERPHQNSSGASGLATITITADNGRLDGACSISNNEIQCSDRGGIEFVAKAGANQTVRTDGRIEDNFIFNPGGAPDSFGILWHAIDGGHPEPSSSTYSGPDSISGNTIRSRGNALVSGVIILCEEHTFYGITSFSENIVDGCQSHGVVLSADGWNTSEAPEITIFAVQNRITGNGGSGVLMEWDRTNFVSDLGKGYIHWVSKGGLIADNSRYGVEVIGADQDSTGSISFSGDNLLNNALGGLGFDDHDPIGTTPVSDIGTVGTSFGNSIVYLNNSNGDQVVGLSAMLLTGVYDTVTYSDFRNIPLDTPAYPCDPTQDADNNIDCDPLFVNSARSDYHLLA